ncbi:hypothetical protein EVG20_g126 [Dentipellis fragilis]|uniref:Uncharacterized protein n=1 Tax=Dentipellis fragilis TaxID=205917 RepID=A0A4Y9ZFS1_9AGAM|nr:hypothetical protein EVG20_g126 [Dentipellis fragilis]
MASPWYRRPNDPPPFTLARKLDVKTPVNAAALFPWDADALKTLWDGQLDDPEHQPAWKATAERYHGLLALAVSDAVYIVSALQDSPKSVRRVRLPKKEPNEDKEPVSCICWALNTHDLFEPLIVYTAGSLIYIFHLKQNRLVGCLLGHGKTITSITTHPRHPYLFCTTSRDRTTRIYDLTRTPIQKPKNPPWSHRDPAPSLAGAAHGLHTTEPEGRGIGRCVAVLVGGRSGGHQAAVLGASFHPTHPLIATCGMRQDLAAAVLGGQHALAGGQTAIQQLGRAQSARHVDLLAKPGSTPEPQRSRGDVPGYTRAAEERDCEEQFVFPAKPAVDADDLERMRISSFRVMTSLPLPYPPTSLQWKYFATDTHDPLVLLPLREELRMLNLSRLQPTPQPPFRCDDDEDTDPPSYQSGSGDDEDGGAGEGGTCPGKWQPTLGWELSTVLDAGAGADVGGGEEPGGSDSGAEKGDIQVLEMGLGGRVVVAAAQNVVSIWEMNP